MAILCFALVISCQQKEKPSTVDVSKPPKPVLELNRYNVAFLIMDGVYNTELTAPFDIFHHTIFRDSIKPMNVFTVAKKRGHILSFEGLNIWADFGYLEDSLPSIDILVVPSGEHHLDSDLEDQQMIDFVAKTAEKAKFITSHCDGAFVLAKAGLLNQKWATTFPSDINAFAKMFHDVEVKDSVLFVHDGKFITSAGGAKSFEASLYLCQLLYGKKVADEIAKGMVIDWNLNKVLHLVR